MTKRCLCAGILLMAAGGAAGAAVYTNSPDANAFVRAAAPSSNYGGAGSLAVSGASATNASGVANGAFDTFIRFNTAAMVANFNTAFGTSNWAVSGATLQVTEVGAPAQTLFNRGTGSFQMRWIANDTWTQGTGTPMAPTTTGITYSEETSLLNSQTDVNLGIYTNTGVNGTLSFALPLAGAFVTNLEAGGEVGLYLTAVSPGIGFSFNSQSFGTASARPILVISAAPQAGIAGIGWSGTNLVLTGTNGAAGGTYYVVASTNATTPLSQWLPVLTNTLGSSGNYSLTVTNAPGTNGAEYFSVWTQ